MLSRGKSPRHEKQSIATWSSWRWLQPSYSWRRWYPEHDVPLSKGTDVRLPITSFLSLRATIWVIGTAEEDSTTRERKMQCQIMRKSKGNNRPTFFLLTKERWVEVRVLIFVRRSRCWLGSQRGRYDFRNDQRRKNKTIFITHDDEDGGWSPSFDWCMYFRNQYFARDCNFPPVR